MSLRDQLRAIYDEHGKLTPALVIDVARDEAHPLHDRFDWDDKTAGPKWRRYQAHELIRSVKVVYREASDTDDAQSVRAFHAVRQEDPDNGGFAYEPAEKVAADPLMRQVVLRDMEREWQTLKRRYAAFAEFLEMVQTDEDVAA